jgi:hypothetical protein
MKLENYNIKREREISLTEQYIILESFNRE